ncbi:hypothetical protein FOL47_001155 [Perkinsus chesapeaki]|uniref:Uncharacterized protein n=1 Tax=Perkinsus chesapeaki TaxID=330153 RepID=A0A7J6MKY1_PERCH|nr:hypothetical protein FOL47_001155 [Perkinsus chesapeaki]
MPRIFSAASEVQSSKPLAWTDASGNTYHYYEHPFLRSVVFILGQELCERLAYYGLTPNLQTFLKEFAGMDDSGANSYISIFNSIIYLTPLVSAALSDTVLGLYVTIVVFSLIYACGLILLTLSAIESISEQWMIDVALLFLIALGAGGIKSCVNIMGAQQFHPEHHKDLITRYYTYFYATINVGSIIGGIVSPILVQECSFFVAFLFITIVFLCACVVFLTGGLLGRYVKPKPQGSAVLQVVEVIGVACTKLSFEKCKKSKGGKFDDSFIEDTKCLLRLVPMFTIVIPFQMVYTQMTTAYLTQATKMDTDTFGWDMPAAMFQNVDPFAVIINSLILDQVIFPYLQRKNMFPSVLARFCMGCIAGACSLLCAMGLEYVVMAKPMFSVSAWWQVPQFWLIALGECFLFATSYEVAFTYSPGQLKACASGLNLLFFSFGSMLSAVLFQVCSPWLPDFKPEDPSTWGGSHYDYYYMVLIGFCVLGAIGSLALIPYFNRVAAANMAVADKESSKNKESDSYDFDGESSKSDVVMNSKSPVDDLEAQA